MQVRLPLGAFTASYVCRRQMLKAVNSEAKPRSNLKKEHMARKQKITISVIGGSSIGTRTEDLAEKVGAMIAELGCVLVCGGLGGAMESAAKGAKKAGGMTIGILPGKEKDDANPYIDISLPTSIGYARNTIVACSADIVVALPGSYGTNSEICYALVYGRPVIDLGNWNINGMIDTKNLEEAEDKIKRLVKRLQNA